MAERTWRRIGGARAPYRRTLFDGKHQREECLSRPNQWCSGIGDPETFEERTPCASCPIRAERGHE